MAARDVTDNSLTTQSSAVQPRHFCVRSCFIQKPESFQVNLADSPFPTETLTLNVFALLLTGNQALFFRVMFSFRSTRKTDVTLADV